MALYMTPNPFQQPLPQAQKPIIKVIGLGGGGSNTVNRMIELGLGGVDYIIANTDAQVLSTSLAPTKIQLGPQLTRGLGAGGDPIKGEAAAEESLKDLNAAIKGADMVFLTAGMGGGTGTGAIPVAARVARSTGAVTVSIVTMPFSFEMGKRQVSARQGLEKLRLYSDTLITVPNDRLLKVAPRDLPIEMAFRFADDVLRQGIQGITELVTVPGVINVDFAHIRHLVQNGGGSVLSIGIGQGAGKTLQAIQQALNHPLLESIPLEDATGIIANFTGGNDLAFLEVAEALTYLQERTGNKAEIIPGVIADDSMQDRVQVILIITGLGGTPVCNSNPMVKSSYIQPTKQLESVAVGESDAEALAGIAGGYSGQTQKIPQIIDSRYEKPRIIPTGTSNNLDIPAFLRKRVRQ